MSYDTAKPYIAGFALIEKDGKICFVLRSNTDWMNGYYDLPSGKVEKGESFIECAIREAEEEVGVVIEEKHLEYMHTMQRQNKKEDKGDWIDVYFRAKKWQGEPYNAEPEIHSEIVWLDPKNLPKNVIPPVKVALENMQKDNKYSQYGFS